MQNGKHPRIAALCLPWGYFRKSSVACKVPPRIERCRWWTSNRSGGPGQQWHGDIWASFEQQSSELGLQHLKEMLCWGIFFKLFTIFYRNSSPETRVLRKAFQKHLKRSGEYQKTPDPPLPWLQRRPQCWQWRHGTEKWIFLHNNPFIHQQATTLLVGGVFIYNFISLPLARGSDFR